jgi:hypothetical protein
MYTKQDVKQYARAAIESMIAANNEMLQDGDIAFDGVDITDNIREQALDMARDMMNDLVHEVLKEIEEIQFHAEVNVSVRFK